MVAVAAKGMTPQDAVSAYKTLLAEVIARRLATAEAELAEASQYEYLVISQTREADLATMRAILAAERCRQGRVDFRWKAGPAV